MIPGCVCPEKIERFDERHYAVDGTPADCVNVALSLIMEGRKPDLVITGINIGRNLAEDITYSGTVGAAMEGLIHGVRSIAFSPTNRRTHTGLANCPSIRGTFG